VSNNNREHKRRRILVINDTQEILELFKLILEEEGGHEVILDSYRPQMMEVIKECDPDLIISDHVFGEEKIGWQLVQRLKMDRKTATIPMIVCSGAVHELKEMEGHLMAKGIGVLYKPFDVDELLELVNSKLLTEESVNEHYRERTVNEQPSTSGASNP
jgi:CheY-like chemotaxis protein